MTKEPPVSFSSLAQAMSTFAAESNTSGGLSRSARTGIIVGAVVGPVVIISAVVLAIVFWRRRRLRVLREQQIAIRRMTIIGPSPSSPPPSLPYPFVGHGHGHRSSAFSNMGTFGVDGIEMSSAKNSTGAAQSWEGYPRTKIRSVAPAHQLQRAPSDDRERQLPVPPAATADSASVFSSKQSDTDDGDRMVLVDGVYVLALQRDDNRSGVDRKSKPPSQRRPT